MTACKHERLNQYSTIWAKTQWSITAEGTYDPDETPCSKVLDEETERFECADCEAIVCLDNECRLEED